jgi:hypothetical protein
VGRLLRPRRCNDEAASRRPLIEKDSPAVAGVADKRAGGGRILEHRTRSVKKKIYVRFADVVGAWGSPL